MGVGDGATAGAAVGLGPRVGVAAPAPNVCVGTSVLGAHPKASISEKRIARRVSTWGSRRIRGQLLKLGIQFVNVSFWIDEKGGALVPRPICRSLQWSRTFGDDLLVDAIDICGLVEREGELKALPTHGVALTGMAHNGLHH